jgi:DNA-3-methyladenine glycosylase I
MMNDLRRCQWACDNLMIQYHDNEYGKIITDDNKLFEKLSLEVFQAGLSWRTVLTKREYIREVFCNFDIAAVSNLTDQYLESLFFDSRIIRNRKKIFATRHNARAVQTILSNEQSFFKFIYSFTSAEKLCCALRNSGFTFIGTTVAESFMQSIGILQAHEPGCFMHRQMTSSEV